MRRAGAWLVRVLAVLGLIALVPAAAGASRTASAEAATAQRHVNSTYFHTSDGVRLHVAEATSTPGSSHLPVLAFVPGWSMPASIWEPQLRAFAPRYRTAALDPRGQGLSDVPATGYTLERRARDIAEFIARYPRVVLIGWSLGALEALQCVHQFGDRSVVALVLVDSSVGEEPAPPPSTFTEALQQDREQTLASFVRAIFRTPQPPGRLQQLVQGALRLPLQASVDLLSYPVPREHWRDIARAFGKPLLYVVTPQFAEQAANLQRNRPGTQVEHFPQAGHTLFVDDPQRFNTRLEHFLDTVLGPPR